MRYYYSHKFSEYLVSSRNWTKGNRKDWWNDTIIILPVNSTCRGPEYRYRQELPWHYKRVWTPPAIVVKIAEAYFK